MNYSEYFRKENLALDYHSSSKRLNWRFSRKASPSSALRLNFHLNRVLAGTLKRLILCIPKSKIVKKRRNWKALLQYCLSKSGLLSPWCWREGWYPLSYCSSGLKFPRMWGHWFPGKFQLVNCCWGSKPQAERANHHSCQANCTQGLISSGIWVGRSPQVSHRCCSPSDLARPKTRVKLIWKKKYSKREFFGGFN